MAKLNNLDKVIAVAGGCIAFAAGGGTAGVAISGAGSGASLLGSWWERSARHGPESRRVLLRVRQQVQAELRNGTPLSTANDALLDGADYALGQILLDCLPPPDLLAQAFRAGETFSTAATRMVMEEVVARDD